MENITTGALVEEAEMALVFIALLKQIPPASYASIIEGLQLIKEVG